LTSPDPIYDFKENVDVDRLTQSLVIDTSRIRKELSWQPPYTLVQGLQATAEWYLELIRSRKA
jgi:nucleoside-diphosphate-sugar epimerase